MTRTPFLPTNHAQSGDPDPTEPDPSIPVSDRDNSDWHTP